MSKLDELAEKLGKTYDIRFECVPSMRVLSSYKKNSGQDESDTETWYKWIEENNFPSKIYGNHDHFDYHDVKTGKLVCLRRIDDNFINNSPFMDLTFTGGIFAILIAYFDQDMGGIADYLRAYIEEKSEKYAIDKEYIKNNRIDCMGEEMLSPYKNLGRYDIFIPVKEV